MGFSYHVAERTTPWPLSNPFTDDQYQEINPPIYPEENESMNEEIYGMKVTYDRYNGLRDCQYSL
jgi:hypothetical protein